MPCLINGIAVVARAEAIEAHYPGGVAAFLLSHEDAAACADGQIVAVTVESRAEAWRLIASFEEDGLVVFRDGWAGDLVLVTLPEGPNILCDWLEVGRAAGELAEMAPELAIVRHSPCKTGEVAIPRSVMNDFRQQMGLATDPRAGDPDPVSIRADEGEIDSETAGDENVLGQFRGESPPRRPQSAIRSKADDPNGLRHPDGLDTRDDADERASQPWPRHPGACHAACRDRLDEQAFLSAGGDPHELAAARACLQLLECDDASALEAMALPQLAIATDLTEMTLRGAPLSIGYLHARYAKTRSTLLSVAAELVAIDDVQLDTATPCRPRACIRLWGGMLEDWMRPLLDAPAPPAAIAAIREHADHAWMATVRFGLDGDRLASIEVSRDYPPDEPMRKGRWGEER